MAAHVEAFAPRQLQCYRCLEPGHTSAVCTAPADRGALCYRCGRPGHTASSCQAKPECPLCRDLGRPMGHRLGSAACAPPRKGRGGNSGGKRGGPTPSSPPSPSATASAQEREAGSNVTQTPASAEMDLPPRPQRVRRTAEPALPGASGMEVEGNEEGGAYVSASLPTPRDIEDVPGEAMDVND